MSVTTDLIAGFPGETDDDFAQTLELVRAARFDAAFTFVFSPRRGTAAADLPGQIAAAVKRERVERLIALTQELALDSRRRWLGRRAEVLVEGPSRDGKGLRGRTRQNVTANVTGSGRTRCYSGDRGHWSDFDDSSRKGLTRALRRCRHAGLYLSPSATAHPRGRRRLAPQGERRPSKPCGRLAAQVGEPETVVVVSPHSDGFGDAHAVRTAPRLRGDLGRFRCPDVAFTYDNDVPFAELLLALAGDYRRLQLVPDDGDQLDWGVLVPLSFLKARQIVSLSIVSAYGEHRTFGQLVRRCAEELGRDTLFLASGDLSHALTHGAPAPYDPRGKLFDDEVVSLLGVGDFVGLGRIDPILLQGAAECGLRSFMALGGFLGDDATVAPEILSYEAPFGVGYMVARFGAAEVERPGVEA